jgi:predicted transposase YdaD
MKSDALFYQLFQTAPQIFFELIATTPACPYQFKSITLKTAEKRLDGFLEPTVKGEPLYFVEVQAKKDEGMYWRILLEIALYFNQNPDQQSSPWSAVVIWFEEKHDPDFGLVPITTKDKTQRIISLKLPDVLKALPDTSLALNVLRPFIVDNEAEVRQNFVMWVQHIHNNSPDPAAEQRLLEVLTQLIEQKFKTLSYKELAKMLNLLPLRELPSGQELIMEERVEMLQEIILAKFKSSQKTVTQLHNRLQQLSLQDLRALFKEIMHMRRLKQLNAWIDQRLAAQQATESAETPPVN